MSGRQKKSYWVGREASRELARNQCVVTARWRKRFLPPDMPPDIYLRVAFRGAMSRWNRRNCGGLVPYNLTLDDFCADFGSCERRDDYALREAAEGGGRGAADFREVISIGSSDFFDHADLAQAMELARESRRG